MIINGKLEELNGNCFVFLNAHNNVRWHVYFKPVELLNEAKMNEIIKWYIYAIVKASKGIQSRKFMQIAIGFNKYLLK